ncbi:MAG: ECF-type sigma factor [Verrucomicrobiota bacterium]
MPLVYDELRRLAAARLANEARCDTLQPTALVHEAWLRMSGANQVTWQNQGHFFAAAAQAMRRILIDRARSRGRQKRQGGQRVDLDDLQLSVASPDERLLLVEEALEKLNAEDPEKGQIVVLKFYGGLTNEEVAASLQITERTVERKWAFAKAWLFRQIQESSSSAPPPR